MMLMIRGIIILHLVSVCIAANTTKKISFETGNKLAVLRFEGDGVSDPLIEHLTEELRQSIRDLKIFNVQNRDITNDIHTFILEVKIIGRAGIESALLILVDN